MEITRPMLTGTEPGKGSTRYSSTAALIEAGYGMSDVIDGAIVTPFAGLRVYRGKIIPIPKPLQLMCKIH